DGALNVVVTGGTGDINYTWFYNGVQLEDRPDLEGLAPGDYILSVTDSKLLPTGCNAFEFLDGNLTRTYTISEPDPLVVEEVSITQVTCAEEDDGMIEVRVVDNNGVEQDPANFVMTWYMVDNDGGESELPNSNVLSRGGLVAGSYRIEVNDNSLGGGNGCLYSETFELEDNLPLEFTKATQQLSCGDATDGAISVQNITGGSPTYNISWRDQDGNDLGFVDQDTITGLGDGTYIATVTDANLCSVTQSGIIIVYAPINIKNSVVNDKLCFNSSPSEASINLELEGGDGGDYIIEWIGPNGFFSDQEDISELEPGDYTVTINQATICDGSEVTQTFRIEEPIVVTATAIVTPETCFEAGDGSITDVEIVISNQPDPAISENSFSYTWRYNGQVIGNSITPPNNLALAAGQYELEINDNTPGSCITIQSFTIEDNPEVTLNPIINQITCAGDDNASMTVEPLGGAPDYTYQWYQESTLPADILTGETNATLADRGPGTYFVVVTDQSGCAKSNLDDPYVIEDIQVIEVTDENVSITQIKCLGDTNGEIAINISGGRGPFDITWQKDGEFFQRDEDVIAADTAESRITNLADGVYTVTIDENSACPSFAASYTIDERTTTFHGGVARPQAITCNDASDGILRAVIEPDAGHPTDFEVEWFKDDDPVAFSTELEITQLGPGTYRSEVTDAFGCMKEASVTLINPDPIFARAEVTELICNSAETAIIQLDPIGGYGEFNVTWSEASTGAIDNIGFRLAGIGAGEYNIAITDTVGCVKDTTILIIDPLAINIIPTVQNIFCQGDATGSIDIDVSEGTAPYTFQWRRDSTLVSLQEDLSELVAGNYTVRVEDANGCVVNSDTISVTEPEISFTIQGEIDRVTCNNGTDGGIQPIIIEEGGTSTYRFSWYKDSVLFALDTESLEGISPGIYTVEVEDASGCIKTRSFEIINPPVLDANNLTEDLSCFRSGDGSISVQPTGGYGSYTYEWSTGGDILPDTTSRLSNLEVGIYQVIVRDAEGCEITRRYQVNQPLPIVVNYVKEDNTCPGPYDAFIIPTVSGGRAPYTFLWERGGEPIADTLVLDSLPPAEYVLTVTDSTLCDVQTDPIIVEAPDPLGFNFLEFVDNLCPTTENGKISVQGIGGTSPYTFSFDSSAFDVRNDFFGLAKGDYALSVMDDVGCVNDTTVEINHQYDLQPDFTYNFQELAIDYDISFEDQTVGPGLTKWFWDFGDERASPEQNPTIQYESVAEYIVTLTVENEVECVASFSDTLNVEQGFVFSIPSGFSPNNDGLNDFFRPVFDNITDIRTNIVDRNGHIVFTSNSREEFWDGRFNGDRMPQGPYYYEISYTSRAGKTRFRKGKVLLLR
ncbi:MAG: gliding motility-associated C-terminal domain-containing protein, partial [Bacteroidota bacterium]